MDTDRDRRPKLSLGLLFRTFWFGASLAILLAIFDAPTWTYFAAAPLVCLYVIVQLLAADPEWSRERDTRGGAGRGRPTSL